MNPIKSLSIDDIPIRLSEFVVPEMSLSSSRSTMNRHSFTVAYWTAPLVEHLASPYALWVDESKADDKTCGAPQDDLALAGYPSLKELLETPSLAELVIGYYLLRDSLAAFTWDGRSPVKYWFDQVTKVEVEEGIVRLHGTCYSCNK